MLCDVTSHWAAREPDESSGDAKASQWRQGMCRRTKAVLDGKPLPAGVKLAYSGQVQRPPPGEQISDRLNPVNLTTQSPSHYCI